MNTVSGSNVMLETCVLGTVWIQAVRIFMKIWVDCIRGRRLRLLSRVTLHAPLELKVLLAASSMYEKSFMRQWVLDLEWLWKSTSFSSELGMQDPFF